jgi:hypothetical protein
MDLMILFLFLGPHRHHYLVFKEQGKTMVILRNWLVNTFVPPDRKKGKIKVCRAVVKLFSKCPQKNGALPLRQYFSMFSII